MNAIKYFVGGATRGRGTKCIEQRRQALTQPQRQRGASTYIPECTTEGAFAEVQCHQETRYCWCVTPEGTPIPGSSVRGKANDVRCRTTKGAWKYYCCFSTNNVSFVIPFHALSFKIFIILC